MKAVMRPTTKTVAKTTTPTSDRRAIVEGYRSGLEVKNASYIEARGFEPHYEEFTLRYEVPARIARYTPDFAFVHNGIIVETKGRFLTADRQKHLLVKDQHPSLDVRFVFSNPNTRISKQSSTTYADWCRKHGFLFAKLLTPVEWMREDAEPRRMAAMRNALGVK